MATQTREAPSSNNKEQQQKDSAEKSARSVFVGNIPYEATDEQLKDIFNQAGPVLSFRLVYDRETGKPKGFGFCEYKDQDTAQSAIRNLNGTEIHGRTLRVDSASSQKAAADETKTVEKEISPYGDSVNPTRAPEAITSAVASLPPEQMFELMKQMKLCIQNNPEEARHMLLQNPQLAYALLQAQVIMKIVDPKVADAILHQPRGEPLPINTLMEKAGIGHEQKPGPGGPPPPQDWRGDHPPREMPIRDVYREEMGRPPNDFGRPPMRDMRGPPPPDRDFRPPPMDDRFREGPPFDPRDRPPPADPRGGPPPMPPMDRGDPRVREELRPPPRDDPRGPPRDRPPPNRDPRDPRGGPPPPVSGAELIRGGGSPFPPGPVHRDPPSGPPPPVTSAPSLGAANPVAGLGGPGGPNEDEKQRLIQQVLNLTEQQINMLPEDQRENIRMLRSQYNSGRS